MYILLYRLPVPCRGGANGATTPGISKTGGHPKSEITKMYICCNYMIFLIVRLLTHAALI